MTLLLVLQNIFIEHQAGKHLVALFSQWLLYVDASVRNEVSLEHHMGCKPRDPVCLATDLLAYLHGTVLDSQLGLDKDKAEFAASGFQHCAGYFSVCVQTMPKAADLVHVPSLSEFASSAGEMLSC